MKKTAVKLLAIAGVLALMVSSLAFSWGVGVPTDTTGNGQIAAREGGSTSD